MAWIGWTVGMSGKPVADAKRKLRQKFSYAKGLDDSPTFTEDLRIALITYQYRKNQANKSALRTDGILDWATQVALGVINPNPPGPKKPRGVILTVQGTGVDMWTGPPADVARAVSDLYYWQPVGNYPASPFPMRQSYRQGIEELVAQCRIHAGKPKVLAGYSQGAIVTSRVWKHEVVNPQGRLHALRDEFVGSVTWGNPDRERGVANGNLLESVPVPEGRGVTDDRMENTPSWWLDFAHGANSRFGRDLYTDTPDDDVGEYSTAIWRVVEDVKFTGVNGLLEQVLEIVERPLVEVVAMFQAILHAGAFFFSGTGPHVNYNIEPAIRYLRDLAKKM